MPNLLLYPWNPMAGCDPHQELGIVPPLPVPVPFPWTPHLVGMFLEGITGERSETSTVLGDAVPIIQLGSDIGPLIPHVPLPLDPPNLLFEVWTLLSSSISIFGPYSVQAEGKPVAAALGGCVNPQMNCNQAFLPLPLGVALTWGTILVDVTPLDLALNVADFLYDQAIDWVKDKLMGKALDKIPGYEELEETERDIVEKSIDLALKQLTKDTPVETFQEKAKDLLKPSDLYERFAGEGG